MPEVFSVGTALLSFDKASKELIEQLKKILPIAEGDTQQSDIAVIHDAASDVEEAIRLVWTHVNGPYQGNLWIDAAVLQSPNGASVMIAGASHAGKSTITTALSLRGWKVVCEDITFVLPDLFIPSVVAPIDLRSGSSERIHRSTGMTVPLIFDRWFFDEKYFWPEGVHQPLGQVVLLHQVDPEQPGTLTVSEVSPEMLLPKLIPISNVLRLNNGVDLLHRLLKQSPCASIKGGSVMERIQALETLLR